MMEVIQEEKLNSDQNFCSFAWLFTKEVALGPNRLNQEIPNFNYFATKLKRKLFFDILTLLFAHNAR